MCTAYGRRDYNDHQAGAWEDGALIMASGTVARHRKVGRWLQMPLSSNDTRT